ncbi:MAG: transposase, partial [candidate division Zixibacteria bacterium]|nr:transposase [candidate division Zixibacteria bacterium]NIR65992.1 transposase [candidate division Zixibacteria bacterium]NIS16949.1 transposase [candidate division Zixibacteria bacterium]NIS47635.1 transposase [candidate division Zixibacteria bacterium]NIT53330.1 transposase [candidate division Zixibacteria bacterium]
VELDSSIKTASFKEPENDKFGEDKQGTDKPRLVLRRSSENADLCNMNPDTLEADVRESCPWSRDVEVALCDLMGGAARSSRNSFQQMALDWKKGYETYFSQPLSEERFPYIWADVKHYDLGNKTRKSYLTLTGCNLAGEYRLLALRETESDSEEVWEMLVRRLERRGLGDPKLFIGKADLPLWNVIPQVFPGAEIQFCWNAFIEKMLEYFPLDFSDEIEGRLLDIQHAETKQNAQDWIEYFKRSFGRNYLRAVNELLKCRANLLNFYSYPGKQWDNLRSGGFIKSGYPSRALLKTVCKYERMHDISLYLVFDCMIRSRSGWGRIKGRRALKNVQNGRRYINGKSVNPRRLKRIYHNADKKVRNDFGTKPGLISRLSSLFTNRNSETKNTHEESEAQADFESRLRIDSERSAAKRLSSESSEEPVENTLSEKI